MSKNGTMRANVPFGEKLQQISNILATCNKYSMAWPDLYMYAVHDRIFHEIPAIIPYMDRIYMVLANPTLIAVEILKISFAWTRQDVNVSAAHCSAAFLLPLFLVVRKKVCF